MKLRCRWVVPARSASSSSLRRREFRQRRSSPANSPDWARVLTLGSDSRLRAHMPFPRGYCSALVAAPTVPQIQDSTALQQGGRQSGDREHSRFWTGGPAAPLLKPVVEGDRRMLAELGGEAALAAKPTQVSRAGARDHEPIALDRVSLECAGVLEQKRACATA
jgi:hypothetical protein